MPKESKTKFDAEESLRNIGIFESLDDDDIAQLSKQVTWKHYRKGVEVFPYQQDSNEVYFIGSGRVRVTIYSISGKEISYQELGAGEIFGELAAVDHLPRAANVIVTEAAQIGIMSGKDFWTALSQYPSVSEAIITRLAGLVRFLTERIYQFSALDVNQRVRAEVLRLAEQSQSGDQYVTIQNFPTHVEIANRVNTHREAVTKELNELSRLGIIKQSRRVLIVMDIDRLSELVSEGL